MSPDVATLIDALSKPDAYPFSVYQRMFERAGFARSELYPLPPSFFRAVISYRE